MRQCRTQMLPPKWHHYFDIYHRHFAPFRVREITLLEFGVEYGGSLDVLIEDAGHRMGQQIATFEVLWPRITDGGVFLIEDLHTSYWANYGGGHKRPGTFIDYAKDLIDQQHAWHSREESLAVDADSWSIRGMHFYDSIIVFDNGDVQPPTHERRGTWGAAYRPA